MTHVICRLTANNRDQLRNPTLGNRVYGLHLPFLLLLRLWVPWAAPRWGTAPDPHFASPTMIFWIRHWFKLQVVPYLGQLGRQHAKETRGETVLSMQSKR